jgi:hypothetical protein
MVYCQGYDARSICGSPKRRNVREPPEESRMEALSRDLRFYDVAPPRRSGHMDTLQWLFYVRFLTPLQW